MLRNMLLKINKDLICMKLHYTFFFGGLAGVLPFLITYLQQLGASPTVIGTIYAFLPFVVQFSKPLVGNIADRHQKHRFVLLCCLVLTIISFSAILFSPKMEEAPRLPVDCNATGIYPDFCAYYSHSNDTMTNKSITNQTCTLSCEDTSFSLELSRHSSGDQCCDSLSVSYVDEWRFTCENGTRKKSRLKCETDLCPVSDGGVHVGQLIYIVGCMVLSWIGYTAAISLGDTITLGLLERKENFGYNRVFGAVGWGLFSIVTGQLIDWANDFRQTDVDYSYGFYVMIFLLLLDMLSVETSRKIQEVEKSGSSSFKNILSIFKSGNVILFAGCVFMIGCFTGILWTFLIVFVNDLGGSKLLIGLVLGVQCFGGELIFFPLSGWMIKKLGYGYSMVLVYIAFAIRFFWYSFVTDPYWILPVEVTQGLCYSIFFAALATYASKVAAPQVAATVQGFLQGLFEGFGVGVGSLFGGIAYTYYGGHKMWLILSIMAAVCAVIHLVVHFFLSRLGGDSPEQSVATSNNITTAQGGDFSNTEEQPSINNYGSSGSS